MAKRVGFSKFNDHEKAISGPGLDCSLCNVALLIVFLI
jgi:hypothetical protein